MYNNQFFKKIGYKESFYESIIHGMKKDKRRKKWKKERKKYGGWDSRAGWALNSLILESLYTWLNLYVKFGGKIVDLTFHKFKINGKELTELDCIRFIQKRLKFLLLHSDIYCDEKTLKKCERYRKEAFTVLAEILPVLGW